SRSPLRALEVLERSVDVVRQVPLRLPQVLDLRSIAIDSSLEDRIKNHIRIRIRTDRANFNAHTLVVADRNTHHRSAIHSRSLNLVRSFKVRIKTPVSIHTGIEQQADVIAVGKNTIHE